MNYDKFIDSKNKTMAPCGFEPQAVAATTAVGRLENSPNMSNLIHIISLGGG